MKLIDTLVVHQTVNGKVRRQVYLLIRCFIKFIS